jgi:hypothetical protein
MDETGEHYTEWDKLDTDRYLTQLFHIELINNNITLYPQIYTL